MTTTEANAAYARLESIVGKETALFCLCAVLDLPYEPGGEAETWSEYAAALPKKCAFTDGTTELDEATLAGMDEQVRWMTVWGEGYSDAEYKQLDDLYRTMTAQLDSTGGLDAQQRDTARVCARMALNRGKLILNYKDKDAISTANTLDKMIRENLKDANMRKADILPTQQQRPDGIVDALKKKHGLPVSMTKDDVMQAFFNWCRSKHYPQTVDAEEHALIGILRTMQKNNDLPEATDLPDELRLGDYAAQFEKEPNEAEDEVYNYLNIVRGEFGSVE